MAHDTVTAMKNRIASFPAALEAQAFGRARHRISARLHLQVQERSHPLGRRWFTAFVAWCGVEAVPEGFRPTWEIGEILES